MSIDTHAREAAAELIRLFGEDALNEAMRRSDAANEGAERLAWLLVCAALLKLLGDSEH